MKRIELIFSLLLVPMDFLMIILAGISAYYLRYADFVVSVRNPDFEISLGSFLKALLIVAPLWIVIFAMSGLYNILSARKLTKEIFRVVQACSTGLMLVVVLIFVRHELFESRFIVLASWVFAICYISFARVFIRWIQRKLFSRGIGLRKAILVGNSQLSDKLMKDFFAHRESGFKVLRQVEDFSPETARDLASFLEREEVNEIIQTNPDMSREEVMRLYKFSDEHHLLFRYVADLFGTVTLKTEFSEIAGIPMIEVKKTSLDGWGRIAKRFVDIIGALILLIIFAPIMIVTAIAIKLDSRGPIFYLDYRSGQYNKRFLFFKFRSMQAHLCDGEGPSATEEGNQMLKNLISEEENTRSTLHKIKNDPRVTRVGKFIRRWSIDELPQFFNVLLGDISLVGPRAHMTLETAKYEIHHKKLLTIKPGITGMAQIAGRSDLSFEEEVKLDTYYMENWSLWLDLTILFRTPWAVIRGRRVE